MLVVGFSMLPRLPGLPFQHPQREPLRQIGEDYGLSQGPHWEHREGLSSAGEIASTHPLCRITAGRTESKLQRRAGSLVFQFGLCLQREHKLTHSHSRPQTDERQEMLLLIKPLSAGLPSSGGSWPLGLTAFSERSWAWFGCLCLTQWKNQFKDVHNKKIRK